ncbi:hypothetical protein HKCCA1058_05905 [Rhodobacterales bacterium HKCCA1058]|nr:hypothetical protein [Rhodobacterales bacterium HKCCA1058]
MTDAFTPPGPLQTAVLFLVFNRPDTTAQVFEAIRKARPPRLYVAADGPRTDRTEEAHTVAQVRKIATAVDWPCELKILFREENLGCRLAVSGAISWFFEHEKQGIILEDDCLPSQSFFWFCEQLLNEYSDDLRIAQICGFNSISPKAEDSDYFFSNLGSVWGWATWRRAWLNYDIEMKSWPDIKRTDGLKGSYIYQNLKYERYKVYQLTYEKKIDTWDYQWAFSRALNGQMCIFPKVSLIQNIGFSDDATHTKDAPKWMKEVKFEEINVPLKNRPIGFLRSWRYEYLVKMQSEISLLGRLLKLLRRIMGV